MPQVISFTRRRSAAHSRSVRVRPPKAKPLPAGANRAEGFHQSTQQGSSDSASLGTEEAIESRISELEAAKTAAAIAGDLEAFKVLKAECDVALAMRLPATKARMDAKHSDFIEAVQTLGLHGYYLVPSAWLKSHEHRNTEKPLRRATAFDDATPVDAEADARRSA